MSMIIETERLFLREMTAGDFDALYKGTGDFQNSMAGKSEKEQQKPLLRCL